MVGIIVDVVPKRREKDTMRVLQLAAALAFGLAGCVPRYTWYNPGVDPAVADRQRAIDSAECAAVAMQSIPLPSLPTIPAPVAQSSTNNYPVSGTITLDGANGEIYTGQYRANSFGAGYVINPAEAQMEGAEAGLVAGEAYRRDQAYQAQGRLADACMMRRGWTKVRAGQPPNLTPAPAAVVQAPLAAAMPPSQPAAPTATAPSLSGAAFQSFETWQKSHGN
jgi:hypothetical protein